MSGPLIEANEGDTIIVHVENNLDMPQSIRTYPSWSRLRVDWHGMLQNGTGYMDGVPGFTQVSYRGLGTPAEADIIVSNRARV